MVTKLFTEYPDSPLLVYAAHQTNARSHARRVHAQPARIYPPLLRIRRTLAPAVSAALRATLQVCAACDAEYCMLHLACPGATWHARWAAFAGVTCALVLGATILVLVFEPMSAGPTERSAHVLRGGISHAAWSRPAWPRRPRPSHGHTRQGVPSTSDRQRTATTAGTVPVSATRRHPWRRSHATELRFVKALRLSEGRRRRRLSLLQVRIGQKSGFVWI
jgi:hypothetical protein